MFRSIVSLLLFGALSPLGAPVVDGVPRGLLRVTPPPSISAFSVGEDLSASGVMVMDLLSGRALFSREADTARPIASLAKIMTALLILENHPLGALVTVPGGAATVGGNTAGLLPGETYTVRDLLGALLVGSANDAAYTLALYHSRSMAEFARAMNERAAALGLQRTHFDNPMGFDSPEQSSTPRDLAWLALYAWKNDTIQALTSRRLYVLHERSSARTIALQSTNHLLASHPSRFFGLKTGTTVLARECLISIAETGGRPYIIVILRSADRYRDTLTLLRALPPDRA